MVKSLVYYFIYDELPTILLSPKISIVFIELYYSETVQIFTLLFFVIAYSKLDTI